MKTTLQVPIDKVLKKESEQVAQEYGFSSLQELVRVFLKQVSTGRILPQFGTVDEFLTSDQEAVLSEKYREAMDEVSSGKIHTVKSVDEMVEQLDKQ